MITPEIKNLQSVRGLVQYGDKFLIVKKKKDQGKYTIPGGRKEIFSDEDESVLKKKIMEQVGLKVIMPRLLNKWYLNLVEEDIHLDGKTYLCDAELDTIKLSDEYSDYLWLPKEELQNADLPNWLHDAISKIDA